MKKFLTVVLLVVGMQGLSGLRSLQAQPGWYVGNKAPLQPLHFIPLPVGSIRPDGWVRKYLELQRDGLTGQLGQISAWLDKTNNAWYSGNGQGDHGWEEVPYWLKGYGDLGYILNDTTIIAETKRWLNKVFQSQRADGYFGPAPRGPGGAGSGAAAAAVPDLWPNMLMLWCMQSYYDYSKDARVIPFMTRYFKWEMTVPDGQLLKTYWENSRGGDNLYSIYWLYNRTGEAWLLDLAKKIHQHTANWEQAGAGGQAGPGGGTGTLPNWHNVNIAQCFREPATYYMQTADKRDLDATYDDFRLVRAIYGQVPGGMFGADENARPGYTDPRQAIETCGMVEQMASDEMLAGITGDVLWADNCEDVAFNTYPAAVMPDFRSLRYLTAPNMVVSDSMDHSPGIQNKGPFLMMNPFSSRCCQHNHAQGWPYYSEHLWMATPDSGVVAMLYGASTVNVRVGDGREVTLTEKTNYPFEERVRITVKGVSAAGSAEAAGATGGPANFPLWLRIPGWCDGATVMVNGVPGHISALAGGYARIAREWKAGDMVELKLPMKVSLRKWETNKNSVSVNYGPLSFSLRITENYHRMNSERAAQDDSKWQASADPAKWPAYEITPGSKWNYGLVLTDKPLAQQIEVLRRPYPGGGFPWSEESVPLVLKVKGDLIPGWGIDQYGLCGVLPQSPVDVEDGPAAGQSGSGSGGSGVQTIELVPMGAARLRISSFPVVNVIPRKERPVTGPPVQVHPPEWVEVLKPEGANIFDTTGGVQVIARGFKWTEGPLYMVNGDYLLFSDVPHNKIYKWKRNGDTSVFLMPSGWTVGGIKEREPGSNGLLYDKYSGSLLLMQQGDRRVAKMDAPLNAAAPKFVVLADHYKGKRLNSPNDGVLAPDGGIYFTDPPYGLDGLLADTAKELTFQGVFYIRADHRLVLVTDELKYPNGIALSPDGKTLYVDNSDSLDRRWMKYGLGEDGLIKDKHVFFQYSGVEHGNPDGMKVNKAGYVFSAGPGGLWVFNPAGVPVARVHVGQLVSNCAFGKDGKEMFITATDVVLRVGLK